MFLKFSFTKKFAAQYIETILFLKTTLKLKCKIRCNNTVSYIMMLLPLKTI